MLEIKYAYVVYVAGSVACLILVWKDVLQLADTCNKLLRKMLDRTHRDVAWHGFRFFSFGSIYMLSLTINLANETANSDNQAVSYTHLDVYKRQIMGDAMYAGCARNVSNCSPEDFLAFIRDAQYVVTDSFHGASFSILMQRPFFAALNPASQNTNSRISNVLKTAGLESRSITRESVPHMDCDIDWNHVDKNMSQQIQAVSYTHLDVYKRQLCCRRTTFSALRAADRLSRRPRTSSWAATTLPSNSRAWRAKAWSFRRSTNVCSRSRSARSIFKRRLKSVCRKGVSSRPILRSRKARDVYKRQDLLLMYIRWAARAVSQPIVDCRVWPQYSFDRFQHLRSEGDHHHLADGFDAQGHLLFAHVQMCIRDRYVPCRPGWCARGCNQMCIRDRTKNWWQSLWACAPRSSPPGIS